MYQQFTRYDNLPKIILCRILIMDQKTETFEIFRITQKFPCDKLVGTIELLLSKSTLTLYGPNSFFRRFSGHNLR